MSPEAYKMVVFGGGGAGKSCLTQKFTRGEWVEEYDPTIEDWFHKVQEIDGRDFVLDITDTAGLEQLANMREQYMRYGDGFILVYSVTDKNSVQCVIDIREEILRVKGDDDVPIVLVGNKSDCWDSRQVLLERGYKISQDWGGVPFYETSAKSGANVSEIFEDLGRQIIRRRIQDNRPRPEQRSRLPVGASDTRQTEQRSGEDQRVERHRYCTFWPSKRFVALFYAFYRT